MDLMKIKLPTEIENVLETIEKNGYEAYVVGGAVRDSVMGRDVSDYDVTTNAEPLEISKMFPMEPLPLKRQENKRPDEKRSAFFRKKRIFCCVKFVLQRSFAYFRSKNALPRKSPSSSEPKESTI